MIGITLIIVGVAIASYGIGVFVGYKVCEYTYKKLTEDEK